MQIQVFDMIKQPAYITYIRWPTMLKISHTDFKLTKPELTQLTIYIPGTMGIAHFLESTVSGHNHTKAALVSKYIPQKSSPSHLLAVDLNT